MDHFRTQYENFYAGKDYYWGTKPAAFLQELIHLRPSGRVLDIGCGEGKDAVYMAQKGYDVTAFDITENGIRKAKLLAERAGVKINAYVDDVNTFGIDTPFDIIYSTGTIQYLFEENIRPFFEKVKAATKKGGLNYFNVFVEKPFLALPPDWDREEKMWKTGDLFLPYADWRIHTIEEVIFEDMSNGVKHYHCMDKVLAEKV